MPKKADSVFHADLDATRAEIAAARQSVARPGVDCAAEATSLRMP